MYMYLEKSGNAYQTINKFNDGNVDIVYEIVKLEKWEKENLIGGMTELKKHCRKNEMIAFVSNNHKIKFLEKAKELNLNYRLIWDR